MLPDLPDLKAELRDIYVRYVSRRAHAQLGAFSEAPRHVIHEGETMRVERANGDSEDSDMQGASAEVVISYEQAETMSLQERTQILNDLADRMAMQMSEKLFTSLNETLDRAGQTVDNRGRPFDAEAILRILDRMEIDFDAQGNPKLPTVQLGRDMSEAWVEATNQLANDPVWKARLEQLLAEKRANWRDREAARKLVG
jgi:hypothetical protein